MLAASDGDTSYVNGYSVLGQVTSIAQHGVASGTTVAAKLVAFAYDLTGDLSSVSRYANLIGTQLKVKGSGVVVLAEHWLDTQGAFTTRRAKCWPPPTATPVTSTATTCWAKSPQLPNTV